MIADKKDIKKVKIHLALDGVGAKKRFSESIGIEQSQLSLFLTSGYISEEKFKLIMKKVS